MQNFLPVKVTKPYKEAFQHYGWEEGVEGFQLKYNILKVALKGKEFGFDKDIKFKVKRRRSDYIIDPEKALKLAKKYNSYYTIKKYDHCELFVVIPANECEKVEKIN